MKADTIQSLPIKKLKPSERPHYVNNADFSTAVVEYVREVKAFAQNPNGISPRISEYIGESLLKISEGLSHKPNFVGYSYREDMVMDALENCIRAMPNFNVNAGTRSGLPNAFSYFTQICFFAFIRRIQREKKIQDTKMLYMESSGIDKFATFGEGEHGDCQAVGEGIVERIRYRASIGKSSAGNTAKKKNSWTKKLKPSTTSSLY